MPCFRLVVFGTVKVGMLAHRVWQGYTILDHLDHSLARGLLSFQEFQDTSEALLRDDDHRLIAFIRTQYVPRIHLEGPEPKSGTDSPGNHLQSR